ncbi:uncharacterized protein JCM6883_000211 [Sporobolomyces salmoneus]|uniref:uncharacterized protein n=1 Tax=Sporobolomyces salmoneus TaxID=183962 RepID=UPI0031778A47
MSEVPQTQPAPEETVTRVSKRSISDALANLDSACRDSLSSLSTPKKRRTAAAPLSSTPALQAILSRNTPRSVPSTVPPPPSYEPTSLPALLSRLSTFKLTTYSPSKPPSLSSLQCALHGWINRSTRERLECVTCKKGIVLLPPSSPNTWNSPAGQTLREEYERLVGSEGKGHESNCPWRMRPCSKGLYRLEGGGLGVRNGGGRRKLLEIVGGQAGEMQQRGLGGMELELPKMAKELVEEEGAKEKLVKTVTSLLADISKDESGLEVSTTTILLAIFGWSLDPLPTYQSPSLSRSNSASSLSSLSSSSSTPILSCSYCLRQVLTSSYLPASPSTSGAAQPTTSTKPKPFNPVSQHYPYCPFIDTTTITSSSSSTPTTTLPAVSRTTTKKKPGYQLRLEAVLQKHHSASTSMIHGSTSRSDGTNEGTAEEGKLNTVKTRELLNYVRGLLGPKAATLTTRISSK